MNQSYFLKRCQEYGINDKNNYVAFKGDESKPNYKQPVFEEDKKGNIRIHYYDLHGVQYKYKPSDDKWPQKFYRTRLQHPQGDFKYSQAKGSGSFPFFTPGIIGKYLHEKTIQTLVITEGEFKAFKAYLCDVDIVGFPSIQGTYNRDTFTTLHNDIKELIHRCGVQNVVFITDADTLTVNYKPGKDLCKRPNSFYTAVRNFYEAVHWLIEDKHCPLQHAYWGHIRTEYCATAKGLDDLLMYYDAKQDEIIEELKKQQFDQYFNGYHLSEAKIKALRKEFGIQDANNFYAVYKEFVGNREFIFKRSRYQFNGEELEYLRHEDADKFFRVASDWYKIINVPDSFGESSERIIPYKVGEINRDYRKYPEFLDQVPKYDWFCNVPSWNGSYKRVIDNCLNVMSPLIHDPEPGDCTTSLEFVKHLFDDREQIRLYHFCDIETRKEHKYAIVCEEEGSQLSVALDYLTLMYRKPTEKLPVLCLVSPEEGTGKTTFLYWQQLIYGSNAVILDNERFKMSFNSHYATKFFVGLDEGFLEIEKKSEKERLKSMVTGRELALEDKGANVKFIPNHIHLVICSNDADRIMYMDEEDSRWFVVRVPKFTKENPHMIDELKSEIPAFLHYLYNRPLVHEKSGRLWFTKDQIRTEQMETIIKNTKPKLDKLIEDIIKDMFLTYEVYQLDIELKWFVNEINREFRYKVSRTEVRKYFREKKGITAEKKTSRARIPVGFEPHLTDADDKPIIQYYEVVCRPYKLVVDDWIDDDEDFTELVAKRKVSSNGQHTTTREGKPDELPKDVPF